MFGWMVHGIMKHGKEKIGEIEVPENAKQESTQYTIDVASFVDQLDKKHAIYLVAEGAESELLFDLQGLGFSSVKRKLQDPFHPR